MSKKETVKALETKLRLIKAEAFNISNKDNYHYHARYNKVIERYEETLRELEAISLKWKLKRIFRRI